MNNTDPRQTILRSPMSTLQIIVVFIAVGLNALDGFDVMSISFASTGIAREWGINKAVLGAVLSMELIGMAVGSIVLGGLADRIGRRPTVLGCLILMTVGMLMATHASGVYDLSFWRVLTGLGIGGVLAAVNAITAEFANARRRDACVSFMSIGYPIGAVFGGVIVGQLLRTHDWRSVFYFGSAFTATLIPLVWFLVPESVHWLARKQPTGALTRINQAMKRMGFAAIDSLPQQVVNVAKGSIADIFAPALVATTVILTTAYFFHVTTFYFILKWVPAIIHDMGFPDSSAAGVLTWGQCRRRRRWRPVWCAHTKAPAETSDHRDHGPGHGRSNYLWVTARRIWIGSHCCARAPGFSAMPALSACMRFSRGHFRLMYVHLALVGQSAWAAGGAALAPWVAGLLFKQGHPVPEVAFVMAMGSLIAALALLFLKMRPDETSPQIQPIANTGSVAGLSGASAT